MAIGNDPTGYMRVDSGWVKSQEYGNSKYMSRAVADGGITDGSPIVADTGEIAQTDTKTSAIAGFTVNGSGNDTYQLKTATGAYPVGATMNTASLSMVVSVNAGTDGTGTFDVAHPSIIGVSSSGQVEFNGTGGFDPAFEAVITYTCDIDEPAVTIYSSVINVAGATYLETSVPTTNDAEVLTRWEYTNEDRAGDSPSDFASLNEANWIAPGSYAQNGSDLRLTPDDTADWDILRAMTRIRLAIQLGDLDVDGVDASTALGKLGDLKTTVLVGNKPPQITQAAITVGGIGADPS